MVAKAHCTTFLICCIVAQRGSALSCIAFVAFAVTFIILARCPRPLEGKETCEWTTRVRGFENTLSFLREGREARRADGLGLEEAVLRHAPEIPSWEIGKCWPYEDWPGRVAAGMPRRDDGVDVVAEKRDGSLVAIQCKNRSGDGSVTARQVREFAGAAPEPVFAERWMVAEARRGRGAEEAAVVTDVAFVDFEADLVGALEHTRASAAAVEDPRTAMQDRAVAACVEVLRAGLPEHRKRWLSEEPAAWMPGEASRATLVLPCGTGKTRVSMRVMSELVGTGRPRRGARAEHRTHFSGATGVSGADRTACPHACGVQRRYGRARRRRAGSGLGGGSDAGYRTDPCCGRGVPGRAECRCSGRLASGGRRFGDLRVIFSTYQSAHHTADALWSERRYAQVLILDEAHRTAQLKPAKKKNGSQAERLRVFTLCHDQDAFPLAIGCTRRRRRGSTTPAMRRSPASTARSGWWRACRTRRSSVRSPSGFLTRRRSSKGCWRTTVIIAIGVDKRAWAAANRIVEHFERSHETRGLTTREALSWLVYGVVLAGGAVGDGGAVLVNRSLAFLNKVQRSRQMVDWLVSDEGRSEIDRYFADVGVEAGRRFYAVEHLDAGNTVRDRRRALRELATGDGTAPRGIANVGIFGEGTDSPSLDAVALLAARRSPTDVIQIVGRCMRRAPGKRFGYVIVPVPLPRGSMRRRVCRWTRSATNGGCWARSCARCGRMMEESRTTYRTCWRFTCRRRRNSPCRRP